MNRWQSGAVIGVLGLAGLQLGADSAVAATSGTASVTVARFNPEAAAQAATRKENARLLGLVRLPAGSTPDKAPQVAVLRQPGQYPATPDLIDQAEFFTLPLSPTETQNYLENHVPQGLSLKGYGGGLKGIDGGSDSDTVFFGDPKTSTRFTDPSLVYTFAAKGSGTALRVDAQTIVVHPHTTDEQVGPGAGAAVVAATGGYPLRIFRQVILGTRQSHDLAVALNTLPRSSAGARSCLADTGGRISITFVKTDQVFTLNPACYDIGVMVKGQARPAYDVTQKVEKTLFGDVGLTFKQLSLDSESQARAASP